MVRFDLGPLLQGQASIAKLKSAYNSLIIGPRVLGCRVAISLYIVKSTLYFWQNGKLLFITLYFRHYSLFLGKLSIYSLFLVWKLCI